MPKDDAPKPAKVSPEKQLKEGRNLFILGLGATLIALITTSVSLYIYHASGDIYLDRSRPGFLPDNSDEEELEVETNNYKYPDSGPVNEDTLKDYTSHLKDYQKDLNGLADPYPSYPLSNQSLGIPEDQPPEDSPEGESGEGEVSE